MRASDPCGCEKRAAWRTFRLLLFLAAASLAAYIPFKYATQLHAIEGLYALLFPLSGVLAVGGMIFAATPHLALRLPLVARAAVATVSVGWLATGLLCVKSLTTHVLTAPGPGLFASFHMVTQHVFLSVAVGALMVVPLAVFAQFNIAPPPEPARDLAAPADERAPL